MRRLAAVSIVCLAGCGLLLDAAPRGNDGIDAGGRDANVGVDATEAMALDATDLPSDARNVPADARSMDAPSLPEDVSSSDTPVVSDARTPEDAFARTDECMVRMEICNEADDDCDGTVDEGFHFDTDPMNCGRCGAVCEPPGSTCVGGTCGSPPGLVGLKQRFTHDVARA